ncbi:SRPBCC family protein [Terrabacter sp. Root181]|uniref:SRPBCC family protein n=1 Tax=Terrabacter sp. Root181 TaxID=1736484 RepID=UPI0006F4BE54|nr:SRPBCC family protein [Terrabacter sp. Root181]KRB45959.1 carbon monoxide dehydrogenase [Terrabacter sp. Root181]
MDLTHSFTVPTSVDDAWALFMDLERVGGCFPGATVTEVTDDGFSGTVKVKLGPIALVYSGSGSFVERDDATHHAVIEAKGKDKRGNGTAGATVTITLSPDGDGTRADVVTDLAVTGKPAQFGRGVMQDVSDKLLGAFVACIEKQLTGPADEPEAAPAAAGAAAGSSAGSSAGASAGASAGYVETGSDALAADTGPQVGVTTAAPAPAAAAHTPPPPRRVPASVEEDAPLDLGSAVMPVLIQRYAGYAAAAAIGVVIGWLIGHRGD